MRLWFEFWAVLGLMFSRLFMTCGVGLSVGPLGRYNDWDLVLRGISALFWPVGQVFSQPEKLEVFELCWGFRPVGRGLQKCFVNTYISQFLAYWLWWRCFLDYKVYYEPGFGVLTCCAVFLFFADFSRGFCEVCAGWRFLVTHVCFVWFSVAGADG